MVVAFAGAIIVVFPYRLYDLRAIAFEIDGHGWPHREACPLIDAGRRRSRFLELDRTLLLYRRSLDRIALPLYACVLHGLRTVTAFQPEQRWPKQD